MSDFGARAAVREVLQNGYGDATQTVLDDRVAGDIVSTLRDRGWFSAQEVAAIVAAAGGSISVGDAHMRAIGDYVLEVSDDWESGPGFKRLRSRFRGNDESPSQPEG